MKTAAYFYTINRSAYEEFKDRGSRFIANAFPVETSKDFKDHIQQLRKEHPKAVHHCFAYRLGLSGNDFRVSDDGEPSGTAGKPILGQIDSRKLTNTAIVVVRYFGGTLLGVPGLINAYKTASSLVLQTLPVIQKQVEEIYSIQFDYTCINEIMQILKQGNCTIIQKEFQLFSEIKTGIPLNRLDEVLHKLNDLRNIEIKKHPNF